jgi:hypothetical protein
VYIEVFIIYMSIKIEEAFLPIISGEKGGEYPRPHQIRRYSAKSILRAMSLLASLNPPHLYYHQTLTFATEDSVFATELSDKEAKTKLDGFIKSFLRLFPTVAIVWFREFQENDSPHFHLMFLIFKKEESPPYPEHLMLERFGREVFRIWRRLNDGKVYYKANAMRARELDGKTVDYFLKGVRVAKEGTAPESARWWGKANTRILKENSKEVSRKMVIEDFHRRFKKERRRALSTTERSRNHRRRKKQKIINRAKRFPHS